MQSINSPARQRLTRVVVGAALGFAIAMAADAAADPSPCPDVITSCGCRITKSQIYTVGNDLSAAQTSEPNCIEIAKDHAILNTEGWALLGNGSTGVGILIRPGADHVIVEGGEEADNNPPINPSGGTPADSPAIDSHPPQSTVALWNIGIEDDADDATILLFANIGGSFFQQDQGNITGGVLLRGVKRSVIGDFRANFNGQFGVMLDHCSHIQINNIATVMNGQNGLVLDRSDNNRIGPATAGGNSKLGTWLFVSSDNVIHDDASAGNSGTGTVLGCSPDTKNCPGNERSNHNRIVNSAAAGNKNAGVVIRKHSESNTVTVNHNDGNGGKKMDMVDENNKCDSNIWYNNTGSGNQSCIH